MKVLVIRPAEAPVVQQISLAAVEEELCKLVEGPVETVQLEGDLQIASNGHPDEHHPPLPVNFSMRARVPVLPAEISFVLLPPKAALFHVFYGTVVITAMSWSGYRSLTAAEVEKYQHAFLPMD